MPVYKPSELREFLDSLGIRPRKGLSQNFLIDGNIIRKIVDTAKVTKDDVVLEIGSGPGSLTEELLNTGATVVAVEKDKVLAEALKRLQTPDNRLHVFCDDILEFPIAETLKTFLKSGQKAKVIANLPYNVTTPILVFLVPMHETFSKLVLMVQDEVARRFTAVPGTSDYSSFTVFLSFYSNPHYCFQVSNHCFFPEPSIQSAIVSLDLKEPPKVSNEEKFFEMTRKSFHQRRKMLRASLKDLYAPALVTDSLTALGLNPLARPEDLTLADFIRLFEKLTG